MKIVPLVSGGLDSTVMSLLMQEEGWDLSPVFIDYGQLNIKLERQACLANFEYLRLPPPIEVSLAGYGRAYPSGLTDASKHIVDEAFLPGRNLLFLLCGAAHASQINAEAVAIGFLDERLSLFPDQKRSFADAAESTLALALGKRVRVMTPLISFSKAEVLAIARDKGISGTYSCHAGTMPPCGKCIACREYQGLEG